MTTTHTPAACHRQMGLHLRFATKSWSDSFLCPTCGAARRYNLNFLGTGTVVCDGSGIKVIRAEGHNTATRAAAAIAKAEGRS